MRAAFSSSSSGEIRAETHSSGRERGWIRSRRARGKLLDFDDQFLDSDVPIVERFEESTHLCGRVDSIDGEFDSRHGLLAVGQSEVGGDVRREGLLGVAFAPRDVQPDPSLERRQRSSVSVVSVFVRHTVITSI
jgi:hypothetical protein